MKKCILLLAAVVWTASLARAQGVKDPQQELTVLQQKVRTLQSTDQQIKGQVATLRKDLLSLDQGVKSSLNSGDSLMKAGMDSLRNANERVLKNEQAVTSVRSSLSLQQNLVIIALVLVICLFLLIIWQRKTVRTLALMHETDMKKLQETIDANGKELSAKLGVVRDEISTNSRKQVEAIAEVSRKTDEKVGSVKAALSGELDNVKQLLKQAEEGILSSQKKELDAEKNKREEAVNALIKKLSAVDEKAEAGMAGAMTFMTQETENYRKELGELRKTLQEVSKSVKARGNTAE